MLTAFLRRVGGWVGCLFGLRDDDVAAPQATDGPGVGVSGAQCGTPARATSDRSSSRSRAAGSRVQDSARQPDEPPSESVGETIRRSLAPRWLVALRTQVFTGLAAIGLVVFGGLTALVTGGLTADLDLAATQAVQGVGVPWFGPLMLAVSAFGFLPQAALIVAVIAAVLWRSGLKMESRFALAASASVILTEGIKLLIGRPRPDAEMVTVVQGIGGHSFPSGHTLFYVTFFGFLAYLAYARLKPGRLRSSVLWATGLLILLVGPSRIWMGHHWASDVLASYALGLTLLVLLVQWYGRRRLATPRTSMQTEPALA